MSDASRENWSSRLGFTLAAVGSAVGLGNMWRFSYMAAENGGAAFVILYVAMTVLVGLPVMLAELTLGRGARRSPVQALVHYGGRTWLPLGALFVLTGVVILAYYGVIAGWTLRYAVEALWSGFPADAGAHFEGRVAEGWDAVGWHVVFMVATAWVVSGGIRGGIERAAIVLMPVLGLLVLGLAVYAAFQDGAGAGYAYYFRTDPTRILRADVVQDAASQAFFSLSLGMGAILTYASYLDRRHDLPREAAMIAVSDFSVAFVAGLVIFPLLFALGLESQVIGGGTGTVGALFVVLPQAFAAMGPAGTAVGLLFFVALLVGGLTSAISLLEVVVASAMDGLHVERRRAAWLCAAGIALLGVPAALSTPVLGVMDQIGGNLFLVFGGFLLAIFVGWAMPGAVEEAGEGSAAPGLVAWRWLLRLVVPVVLAGVLFYSVQRTWVMLTGG
ncbi:MAG: sodium-dependent transporter [Myxococcota bacterium]|nr:sodium-dependent transporter [Myxococcota bacterium]